MIDMNCREMMKMAGATTVLLAMATVNGLSGLAFAQGLDAKQPKQAGASQDGLFDYETTQDQDRQLQEQNQLKRGDIAPDIKLTPLTDSVLGSAVQLSSLYKERPAVVFMGSCTCGLTNRNVPQMEKLYKEFRDKADFAFIYMKDAHPAPNKSVEVDGEEVQLAQPETMSHRIDLAKHLLHKTGLTLPVYIDDMKGSGRKAFSGFHLSAFVIGTDGTLVFARPYKYDVTDVKTALIPLLNSN